MAGSADADFKTRLQNWIPKLVLSPSLAMMLVFVYGFILFSVYLSFTDSRILPTYGWVGWENYDKLWRLSHWETSLINMGIFASLYIVICTCIGLVWRSSSIRKSAARGLLAPDLPLSRWR